MRRLVEPSARPARIQDPYALRTLPQSHGAFLDRLADLDLVVAVSSAAPSENPVFLPDVGIAHHGGFHAVYLAQALDAARAAAAKSAQLSGARLAMLMQPAFTGLPAFLAAAADGRSGVMVGEYIAAAAGARLRALATPAAVQTAVVSLGVEDDASFAALGAAQALQCLEPYRTVLAVELVAAVRALRMRQRPVPEAVAGFRVDVQDRDLTDDIALAEALLPSLEVELTDGSA
jgi:histidine ammonia-lyase